MLILRKIYLDDKIMLQNKMFKYGSVYFKTHIKE